MKRQVDKERRETQEEKRKDKVMLSMKDLVFKKNWQRS